MRRAAVWTTWTEHAYRRQLDQPKILDYDTLVEQWLIDGFDGLDLAIQVKFLS
jgi:hypothetical protein